MRVVSNQLRTLDSPIKLYDVINANPSKEYQIVTNSGKSIISHNCGILDEVDFAQGANAKMEQSKIFKLYKSVKARMQSRFLRNGDLPAMLFLVSSKKSEADFIEQYVSTLKGVTTSMVVDESQWVVKPHMFGKERFKIAVGNKYIKSKIIESQEEEEGYLRQGHRVIEVPVELRRQFELDMEGSLMDLAGISTTSSSKFMSYERISQCYIDTPNPFTANVLTIGLDDDLQIKDFFKLDQIPDEIRSRPGFVHIDTSLTGDKTGISYVIIAGAGMHETLENGEIKEKLELHLVHVFSVAIKAPSSSEISLEKSRQFIYYLSNNGFNIKKISTDGFQSADTRQILKTNGYDAELVSLDRSPEGYITTRSCINEKRIALIKVVELETEMINLERDNQSGKIDHPSDGSKDISDSLAGAIYNAHQYKDKYLSLDASQFSDMISANIHSETDIGDLKYLVTEDDSARSVPMSDIDVDGMVKELAKMVDSRDDDDSLIEHMMSGKYDDDIIDWG